MVYVKIKKPVAITSAVFRRDVSDMLYTNLLVAPQIGKNFAFNWNTELSINCSKSKAFMDSES